MALSGTFGDIDTSTFLGWSSDGKLVAQKRSVGRFDMENPEKDWILDYILVQDVKSKRTVDVFKVNEKNVPTVKDKLPLKRDWLVEHRREVKVFKKARPASMWPDCQATFKFSTQKESSLISPSSRWKINMKIEGMPTALKSKIEAATGEDEEESGDFSCGGEFAGLMYKYNAFDAAQYGDGKWLLYIEASNANKFVQIGRTILESTDGKRKGRFVGCLGTYWGPEEKSVAVKWIWRPIVDGPSSSEVVFSPLD